MSLLRSLFSFKGRVGRKYYWLFLVGLAFYAALAVAISLAVGYLYLKFLYTPRFHHTGVELNTRAQTVAFVLPLGVLMVAGCVAGLSVMVRRMHDRNYSARWVPIWIVLALVTIFVRSMLDEPFRRSITLSWVDWWFVLTRYGMDLLVYGATMVLGGLPAITILALKTYRNLNDWPVTQSALAIPVLIPLALFGLWYLVEAGFRRGTVGPNRYGPDPLQK
jgi:uncharacterized membrane protein YhaH (DUF805 family)